MKQAYIRTKSGDGSVSIPIPAISYIELFDSKRNGGKSAKDIRIYLNNGESVIIDHPDREMAKEFYKAALHTIDSFYDNNEEDPIYELAIETFGIPSRIEKSVEEAIELTSALEERRKNKNTVFDLVDEIADVEIMIAQLRIIYGDGFVDRRKAEKIDKLRAAIIEEKMKKDGWNHDENLVNGTTKEKGKENG